MRISRKLVAVAQSKLFLSVFVVGAVWAGVGPARQPAGTHPIGQANGEAEFTPADCAEVFTDVPAANLFCPWIERLAADGVSTGCGDGNFCPDQPVTRQQLALHLEKAMRGTATWDVNADKLDGLDSSEFVTVASLNWASFRRRFYLTTDTYDGSQPLTACASGFHMASIWEILDVSNLVYDTSVGHNNDDSGSGPPTSLPGWARTGDFAGDASEPNGPENCSAWTSTVGIGTYVVLPRSDWKQIQNDNGVADLMPGDISPWAGYPLSCTASIRVWCVQD